MLKPLFLLPAVLALAYFPAPVGSPVPQKTAKSSAASAEAEKKEGVTARVKEIYKFDCAMCHGDNGDGKTDLGQSLGVTSNFSDPKALEGKSDQQIFDSIRKGKDKMPPEDGPRATDDQVRGLVQYLRNLSKNGPAPAPAPAPEPASQPAPQAAPASSPSTN
jgi:mono/diheme cytochrome c family protein